MLVPDRTKQGAAARSGDLFVRNHRVDKVFSLRTRTPLQAMEDVTLDIHAGEFISIAGPSGCGKSTLMMMVSGQILTSGGEISIENIKSKPRVTRDFVQATMKGAKFTLDHPKEAGAMLKKHQPQLDLDVALLKAEILRNRTTANTAKTLGAMTKQKMTETQDLMVKYLDLKPVNIDEAFTDEFLTLRIRP